MNLAVITIGNRDIKLKDQDLLHSSKSCRENGSYILKNYSKLKDKIKIPIIQPFLDNLNDRNINVDKFILIATDQNNESYKKSDTVFFAKVIKKHFERKKMKTKIIILNERINDFIYNYNLFQKKLKYLDLDLKKIKNIYLLPVGGIPNINTPLILSSILIFRNKLFQYYVDKIYKNCYPVPFNQKLLGELEKEKVKSAAGKFFFASISDISSNNFVKMIADYAYNRLSFNLVTAKILGDDLIEKYPDKYLKFLGESITEIRNSFEGKIKEIFFTSIVKIKQKQYVDALLRLYSFTDNLLLKKVCELYDLKYETDKNFEKWWKNKAIKKIEIENSNIKEKLEIDNVDNPDLKRSGIPLYSALIKYKNDIDPIFKTIKPLLTISELRNKSIAAHGFEGVSLEKINNKLRKYQIDLKGLIKNIEKYLDISFENSVYNKVKVLIAENL